MVSLPCWQHSDAEAGYYEFVRKVCARKKKIRWVERPFSISTDVLCEDETKMEKWLRDCAIAITRCSPLQLVTLYTYTSTAFCLIQTFIATRGSTVSSDEVTGEYFPHTNDVRAWIAYAPSMFDAMKDNDNISKYAGLKPAGLRRLVDSYNKLSWQPKKRNRKEKAAAAEHLKTVLEEHHMRNANILGGPFWRKLHAHVVRDSEVILFYPHAKNELEERGMKNLGDFVRLAPHLTREEWTKIFKSFVKTLDGIILSMPPLTVQITVFRGTTDSNAIAECGRRGVFPSCRQYVSTTLDKSIACGFARKKGCIIAIPLEIGSRVLPLLTVTRYWAEQEVLLPRVAQLSCALLQG